MRPKPVPNRDPQQSSAPPLASVPKALILGAAAVLASQLVVFALWAVVLLARFGFGDFVEEARERGNPYADAYNGAIWHLASWLVPAARSGEAIEPHLRFEQPWNQGLALLVGIAGTALIIWLYQREGSIPGWSRGLLTGLRVALLLLAMFMLSEAVLSVDRTGLPSFVVMVDDSASASVADQYADARTKSETAELAKAASKPEASRLAIAQGWLGRDRAKLLTELQKHHKVRLYLVSAATRPLAEIDTPDQIPTALSSLMAVEPIGDQSRLGDGVRKVLTELRGAPPTAILLMTDGQNTDGEALAKAAEFAKSKGVPIVAMGLGDPAPARDLELSDLQVDDVVFVDDQVRFEARLTGHALAGEDVDVVLKRSPAGSTDPRSAEEVGRTTVRVPPDGRQQRVEVRFQPRKTGEFIFSLDVAPKPREIQVENNHVEHTVSVREEKLKVLLADGEPRYEFRYLLSFLKRDKTIDLRTVLQSSDPEFSEEELTALPTFPTARDGPDGIMSYDVIVLGDLDPSLLGTATMRNLAEFVEKKGGGLMFIAGENYDPLAFRGTPLEPLLPLKLAEVRNPFATGGAVPPFRPALTTEGRTHPVFRLADDEAETAQVWKNLPELDWFLEIPRKQELAFVLAVHPSQSGSEGPMPLLLYQYVGGGKVVFQAFDETWKWRFRAGDRYFGRYWIQTLRFLARTKLLGQKQAEVLTDRRQYQRQQPIRVQVRFVNPAAAPTSGTLTAQVDRRGQPPRRVTLKRSVAASNLFEGVLAALPEGNYDVKLLPPPLLTGGMPSASFRVAAPANEFEHVPMNEAELVRAATNSGGKFTTPLVSPADLLKELPAPQMVPLDTDPPIALWNAPALLGVFLALLAVEWVLRKRNQLV